MSFVYFIRYGEIDVLDESGKRIGTFGEGDIVGLESLVD